jgi:hypothetical protein
VPEWPESARARVLSVFGLAKNTGKTQTVLRLIALAGRSGCTVGLTSIGRDGESRDVTDQAIEKPRVRLPAGCIFATTRLLLDRAGTAAEVLRATGYHTALGSVLLARMRVAAEVEIAGPATAAQTREVAGQLLELGADFVLIDGAIDRRSAAAPAVAGSVVMATGAVLGRRIADVVAWSAEAAELLTLPRLDNDAVRALGISASAVVTSRHEVIPLAPSATLAPTATEPGAVFAQTRNAAYIVVAGALCTDFAEQVLAAFPGAPPVIVVRDATRVFFSRGSWRRYRGSGLRIQVTDASSLVAITVNPVSPGKYQFDSAEFCALLSEAVPGVPVCDVLEPESSAQLRDAAVWPTIAGRTDKP